MLFLGDNLMYKLMILRQKTYPEMLCVFLGLKRFPLLLDILQLYTLASTIFWYLDITLYSFSSNMLTALLNVH